MRQPFDPLRTSDVIRPRATRPDGISEDGQRLSWRWFDPTLALFLIVFAVFWNGGLIMWYSNLPRLFHSSPGSAFDGLDWIFAMVHCRGGGIEN